MPTRFNFKFVVALLSLGMHAGIMLALAQRMPQMDTPAQAARVIQVSVSQKPTPDAAARPATDVEQKDNAEQGASVDFSMPQNSAGEPVADAASLASPQAMQERLTSTAIAPQAWPELSRTPFFRLDDLPFIGPPDYYETSQLDTRPAPEEPIIVPFPEMTMHKKKATVILILYISAAGIVERVELDQSDVSAEFEQAAIDTFNQARMRPGIKDKQAVPVRMKIAVEFESK